MQNTLNRREKEVLLKNYTDLPDNKHGRKPDNTSYTSENELHLWNDFRKGDENAFIKIYKSYFYELISFGHQFSHDKGEVEDLVQDLFIDLRNKHHKLPAIQSSLRAYLFQSLKRRIFDKHKKAKDLYLEDIENKWFEIVLPVEHKIILETYEEERLKELKRAIDQLSLRQREILYYLYYKNMSYADIQTIMGLESIKSVRNLAYKAITSLKSNLNLFIALIYLLK
ncbi:MAG: sigma-70 family RNA polymerase sigma factor [Cyclobacteriaceae bacterium]|nr:sigma-70 family RNA polymerase sigma factor [Cyclobacteriaceae bacterium]